MDVLILALLLGGAAHFFQRRDEHRRIALLGRHLGQTVQINTVPYGSRFLAANQDKTTNSPLPDNFFRPFYGYGNLPYFSGGIAYYRRVFDMFNVRAEAMEIFCSTVH